MQATICSNLLVTADRYSSYIPLASTVTNLVDIFLKYVVIPRMQEKEVWNSHYYMHLDQKSFARCITLLVPILGNIIIATYDFVHRQWDDKEQVLATVKEFGYKLNDASARLQNDKEVALAAMQNYPFAVSSASNRLRNDKDFMLASMKQNIHSIHCLGSTLKNDKDAMLAFVKQNGLALEYVGEPLKKDKEVVSVAMQQNSAAAKFIAAPLKNDKDFMFPFVKQDGALLEYVGEQLKDDPEVVLAATQSKYSVLRFASSRLKNDKEFMLAAIEKNSFVLQGCSTSLKDDKEFMLLILKTHKWAIAEASDRLRDDRDFMLAVIQQDSTAMKYIGSTLRKDKDFILTLLNHSNHALGYADEQLLNDREFILDVMKHNALVVLPYLKEKFQDDKEIMLIAVKEYGWALEYASLRLREDKEVTEAAIEQDSNAVIFTHPKALEARSLVELKPKSYMLDIPESSSYSPSPGRRSISPFPLKFQSGYSIFTGPAPLQPIEQDFLKTNAIKTAVMLLEKEAEVSSFYAKEGVHIIHFPIQDYSAPSSSESVLKLTDEIIERSKSGNIYVHCLTGKGRTGMIMACLIKRLHPEKSSEQIIEFVRKAIPGSIEKQVQEDFIKAFTTTGK